MTNRGEVEAGIALLDRSLAIRREIPAPDLKADSLYSLALAERSRNDWDAATRDVEEALRSVESSRLKVPGEWLRSNYLATRSEIYELAIDLLMENYRREPAGRADIGAFQTHESMLSRALIDRLGISPEQVARGVDKALLQRAKQLEELVNFRSTELLQMFGRPHQPPDEESARSKLESALGELRLVEAQISGSSPEYRSIVGPGAPSIDEIRHDLVGSNGLMLEFSLGEPRSYVWAITDSDFRCYTLPGRRRIEQWAAGFADGLSRSTASPETAATLQASRALGELLKEPLEDHSGKSRLLVVAEGKLLLTPFAAIQVANRRGVFHYLIDSWETSMLPSAQAGIQLLRRGRERTAPSRGIAVLADPVFRADDERVAVRPAAAREAPGPAATGGYARLPFTRLEANAILSLKPSKSDLSALDFAANVRTAKSELGAYRIVHFSTHAYIDAQHPESSGLELSMVDRNGKEEDGMLRLPAIIATPLHADLVVLSGCETAAGREVRTEGILGLTQGFVYAGAQQVVSSLWPVEEFGTRELMTRFYSALILRGLKPAAAMRAAQLSMRGTKAWAPPAAWASFLVYGISR
jgi:CHAT domain-containing protein